MNEAFASAVMSIADSLMTLVELAVGYIYGLAARV
jgi:hypothetical protein